MSKVLSILEARRRQAQAARARQSGKSNHGATMEQSIFKSLDDLILSQEGTPTLRAILCDSARGNPQAALQALKQMEALPPEQRQAITLTHSLQLTVPPELFLSAAEDLKAAAREALGL